MSSVIGISLLLFGTGSVHGQQFEYLFNHADRYRIISTVDQQVYRDQQFSHDARFQNIINVEVRDRSAEQAQIHARYRITEESAFNDQIQTVQNEYEVVYTLTKEGVVIIDPQAFLPMVRNVPRFPQRSLAVGDRWAFVAEEVLDFRAALGITQPFRINTVAQYEYIGTQESTYDGQRYPTIRITYPIETRRRIVQGGQTLIVNVFGQTNQTLLWDPRRGRPHSYREEYRFGWTVGANTVEFAGVAQAYTIELSDAVDQTRRAQIATELDRAQVADVQVDTDEEGVILSIGKLRFVPDSATLLSGEAGRIAELARLITAHNPAQVLVIGHTAHAGTKAARQRLSELRAHTIGILLQEHGVSDLVIQGVGSTQPLADNDTEAGRQQNRRVEIKLIGERQPR